jgi:hypothetical protein
VWYKLIAASARLQSGSWSVEWEVGGCMPSGASPNRDAGMPVRLGLGINKKRGRGDMSGGLLMEFCSAMYASCSGEPDVFWRV